jgi:integrase/recombinase XerC
MDAAAGPAAGARRGPAGWSASGQGTAGRGTINSGAISNRMAGRGTAGHSAGGATTDGRAARAPLPEYLAERLAAFERHLAAERGLSAHTVRAYLGDIRSLRAHACEDGRTGLAGLDVGVIRGWLASQHAAGQARATLARRAASARTFTAFARSRGWLASDPGPLLGTPKARRHLPQVLAADQVAAVLDAPGDGDTEPVAAAVGLRDVAIMELLYASALRVSELCGMDIGDIDDDRRTVRVLGKGNKERIVPVGVPAARAVRRWQHDGRPLVVTERSGHALFVGARGGRLNPRTARRVVHAMIAPCLRSPIPVRTLRHWPPPTCWWRRGPAERAGVSPRRSRHPDLHHVSVERLLPPTPGAPQGVNRRDSASRDAVRPSARPAVTQAKSGPQDLAGRRTGRGPG